MNDEADRCYHCNGPIPPQQEVVDSSGSIPRSFCCRGCLGAYRLISGIGMTGFYQRRSPDQGGLTTGAYSCGFTDETLQRFVYHVDDSSAIDILIDGIRCAACVWLNEAVISRIPGVEEARINYGTGRGRVVFNDEQTSPSAIFQQITELGYVPKPFTPSLAEKAAEADRRDLLLRFGTAVFLSMQLMAYAFALYAGYFQGISPAFRDYLNYFSFLVTTPLLLYSGAPFFRGAVRSIANRAPSMDLLIALGALSSYLYSCYALLNGEETYFETAAMIITLILAGRLLELGARRHAMAGVERLRELTPTHARRISDSGEETVPVIDIHPGDILLVGTGERFPVDGILADGSAEVDESPATGESRSLLKEHGEELIAGSINLGAPIRMRVTKTVDDSFVSVVARLVEDAQNRRPAVQQLADRISAYFVPAVLLLALLTFGLAVMSRGTFEAALLLALAVVVIACPCALGLATPTAILVGTGKAAARGIIFRGGDVLERLSGISDVMLDKTGTVTLGKPLLNRILPVQELTADRLHAVIAAVETGNRHPLAVGILDAATARGILLPAASDIALSPGRGVKGMVDGLAVLAGNERFLSDEGIQVPQLSLSPTETAVYCAWGGAYAGVLLLSDRVRPGIVEMIRNFEKEGITVSLLSGDRDEVVRHIAAQIGVTAAAGGLEPAEKAAIIRRRRSEGSTLLMVGDGINDAPALATADVGCAFAGGTDIAIATSDLVLSIADPAMLITAYRLSRRTMRIIRQNLAWAFIYNLVGIPLAMAGLLTPIYAAAAMALSSFSVVLNSLRLRNADHG